MISLGMLSGPGVFPLARFLRLRSKTSPIKSFAMQWLVYPLFSRMHPFVWCQGYFHTTHVHCSGWYMGSTHSGVCLWNDYCWHLWILLIMSRRFVWMLPKVSSKLFMDI